MITLDALSRSNISDFVDLLSLRGEAPVKYYHWKYLDQPFQTSPTGFIAYDDGAPVGCIGIINRHVVRACNTEHPATWFADWFVKPGVRGKGVGRLLMEEVRKNSSFNYGIPGPSHAQVVCASAGYFPVNGFYEYHLYLNAFSCGLKRFGGGLIKRSVRGVRAHMMHRGNRARLHRVRGAASFSTGFPDASRWTDSTYRHSLLIRDRAFITWLGNMPLSDSSDREWWSIDEPDLFACGFYETDFWGLKKATILDLYAPSRYGETLLVVAKTLLLNSVDWLSFCFFEETKAFDMCQKSMLPLYFSGAGKPEAGGYLSGADKDSVWRTLQFSS